MINRITSLLQIAKSMIAYWAISIAPIAIHSLYPISFNLFTAILFSALIFTSHMLTLKRISRNDVEIHINTFWQAGVLYIATSILLSFVFMITLINSNALAENASFTDFFYFCIVTLTTLGYGDITPKNEYGKIIASAMSLIGTTNMIMLIAIASAKLKSENDTSF